LRVSDDDQARVVLEIGFGNDGSRGLSMTKAWDVNQAIRFTSGKKRSRNMGCGTAMNVKEGG